MKDLSRITEAHYRARPFWSWNTEVTEEKVRSQIKMFRDMGMGGFVIHSRNGLRTEYMGEEFMSMVKLSVELAKTYGMKVWIYDEDRWPSGNSGGKVTCDRRFRQRSLVVTKDLPEDLGRMENNEDYLVAAYKLRFNSDGDLLDYSVTTDGVGDVYAYVHIEDDNPRYNFQSNVDVMNPDAIRRFIDTTYERYYDEVGEHFGKTVEAIFTDEPQGTRAVYADYSDLSLFTKAMIMWTDDLPKTYYKQYGESIIEHIPAILWDSENSSRVRYRYHEHCAERFKEAYSSQLGAWCEAHGIAFTGHFIYEDSMYSQTVCTKDVMRFYADQQIPGIDVLQGKFELLTALQCRSVARQYGRRRVMSELYGVNNWDTPFREFFLQGNWQTAMGVNVRIPHLSWMSMLGEGKRDYPATFGYQSPWYLDNNVLEDHFSRLHKIFENGESRVRVGVIHPIESYWTLHGAKDKTSLICAERDRELTSLFEWLSFDGIDLDLINEALLPEQITAEGGVGEQKYETILIPDCVTLRRTTLDALNIMKKQGVKIIFAGDIPALCDGLPSSDVREFANTCTCVGFTYGSIASALKEYKAFELTGELSHDYIFNDANYDGFRWLFLAPARAVDSKEDSKAYPHVMKLCGRVTPTVADTLSGKYYTPEYYYSADNTYVKLDLYRYGTLLLRIEDKEAPYEKSNTDPVKTEILNIKNTLKYRRHEDNVLLLDRAEYSLDGEHFEPCEEILHADTECRRHLGLGSLTGKLSPQPWSVTDECAHKVSLRFSFDSEIETPCRLSLERATRITFNGEDIPLNFDGYYVDEDIRSLPLPSTRIGKNILELEIEIGKTYGAEPVYLTGDFDVRLCGVDATLTAPSTRLAFGSVVGQGMPFYGGSISYVCELELEKGGDLTLSANYFRAPLLRAVLDGEPVGSIILPPYSLTVPDVRAGKHTLELVAVGNRHNTFGSLHWGIDDPYYGPAHWHKYGDAYSREYRLRDFGIMKCPVVTLTKNLGQDN